MKGSERNRISVNDFRRYAKRHLPHSVFDFVDGGANDEVTLRANVDAFDKFAIFPRILNEVSNPNIETKLLGSTFATPMAIAPMGSCALVRPGADYAIASAAAKRGIPYTLSTMSTASMDTLARKSDGPLWFQLYVLKDWDFNEALVKKAQDLGYSALVVTVDLQAGGKREKDLRNGVTIPMRPSFGMAMDAMLHPLWTVRQIAGGMPDFENVRGYLPDTGAGLTIAARVGQNLDADFNWDGFKRIRELWKGPILVKGVLHPQDAQKLAENGADGIWISNHGGRQLDRAPSSLSALARISDRLKGRVPLILDSGVRRGTDMLIARALGATMVATGRAVLYGATDGERGAGQVLDILKEELILAMKLSGQPDISAVTRELVRTDSLP